jgi:hypothetical protein
LISRKVVQDRKYLFLTGNKYIVLSILDLEQIRITQLSLFKVAVTIFAMIVSCNRAKMGMKLSW